MNNTETSRMIRVTLNLNYELRGEPHHQDEVLEKINEHFHSPYIPSDHASTNPRWTMVEGWREIILTGL